MDKDTSTISAPFRKEPVLDFQKLLEVVEQLESQIVRLEITVAALKVGFYALTQGLKMTLSKAE